MAEKHVSARTGAINPVHSLSATLLTGTMALAMRNAVLAERALGAMSAMDAGIDTAISLAEAAWGDVRAVAASILGKAEDLPDPVVVIAAIVERLVALRDEEAGEVFMRQVHDQRADLWLAACRTDDHRLQRRLAWALDALQDMRSLDAFGGIAPPEGPVPAAPSISGPTDLAA